MPSTSWRTPPSTARWRQAALNTDSVSRVGVYGGPGLERLWVQTHTERLYLWDWTAACDESAEGAARARPPLGAACLQKGVVPKSARRRTLAFQ